jgi:hypothetical protein
LNFGDLKSQKSLIFNSFSIVNFLFDEILPIKKRAGKSSKINFTCEDSGTTS